MVVIVEIKSEPVYCFEHKTKLSSDCENISTRTGKLPKHEVYTIALNFLNSLKQ